MSRAAVGQAIEAMQDDGLRAQVEAGDLSGLPSAGELEAGEQAMVIAAAGDYPEVAGFSFSWSPVGSPPPTFTPSANPSAFGEAVNYSYGRVLDHQPVL